MKDSSCYDCRVYARVLPFRCVALSAAALLVAYAATQLGLSSVELETVVCCT